MPEEDEGEGVLASFDLYSMMAHFVGKQLHIRPSEILDTWSVPELIVAFGEYANEIANRNYKEWKSLDPQTRAKTEKPPKYIVKFIGVKDMQWLTE